jgi:hypothetical protein
MKRLSTTSLVLAVVGVASVAAAQELAELGGAWNWKFWNQSAVYTLKLKLEEDKLTGTIQHYAGGPISPIEDAAFKEGVVSFKHIYKGRMGETIVSSYKGMVSGDTINGSIEFNHPDRAITRDWHADRAK